MMSSVNDGLWRINEEAGRTAVLACVRLQFPFTPSIPLTCPCPSASRASCVAASRLDDLAKIQPRRNAVDPKFNVQRRSMTDIKDK
jgi:hypothetical protein